MKITEEMTKMMGFDEMEHLPIKDNVFFYKHPSGFIRLACYEMDITDDIKTLERFKLLYYGLTGKELSIKWFS